MGKGSRFKEWSRHVAQLRNDVRSGHVACPAVLPRFVRHGHMTGSIPVSQIAFPRAFRTRNTAIRRRVQASVLCEALKRFLPEDCPNNPRLLAMLAKIPSEGERKG